MSLLRQAQAALGCLIIEREVCSLRRLATARFAGPTREMRRGRRPSLIIDAGNRERNPRHLELATSDFSVLVDAYYIAVHRLRRRQPLYLFEKEDGSRKSGCTVSNDVKYFTGLCGHAMTPTVLRERQVLLAHRHDGLDVEALRDLVDASTTDNSRYRYQFLQQIEASGRFAAGSKT